MKSEPLSLSFPSSVNVSIAYTLILYACEVSYMAKVTLPRLHRGSQEQTIRCDTRGRIDCWACKDRPAAMWNRPTLPRLITIWLAEAKKWLAESKKWHSRESSAVQIWDFRWQITAFRRLVMTAL